MTDNQIDKIVKEVLKSAKLRVKTPFLNELPVVYYLSIFLQTPLSVLSKQLLLHINFYYAYRTE